MSVFPLAVEPLAKGFPPADPNASFKTLIKQSDAQGQYLIEIVAYKGGEVRSGGLATLGEIPLGANPKNAGVDVGQVTLVYADRHWAGAPTDTVKPNVFYEGRVTVPLVMERSMPLLPEETRRVQRQFGVIEIANGDGALDPVVQSYAVDGRDINVLFGPYMGAYSGFKPIACIVGDFWEANDLVVQLSLRCRAYTLDLPLQTNLYGGTGGADGTAEIEGKPKPLLFGRCRNVAPVLIDPTNLIYQTHDGTIHAVDDVFDRAAALTASGIDVSGYANLLAQPVSAGQFATALDVGMFKLGSSPDGLITADIRGDAAPSYADTLDVVALRIIVDRHGLDSSFVNSATFAGPGAIGGEMGVFISHNETPTTGEVLDVLMASVGGWWGAGRDSKIRAGRLQRPEDRTPDIYLDQFNIVSLEPEGAPMPRWRQRVAYQRNWTEQRGEDLAASVDDARRQFLTEEIRVVTAANADTKNRHLQALDPNPLPTLYEAEANAQTIADDLLALHSPDRRIFRATVKRIGYLLNLQAIAHVTWPRLGLQGGQKFSVIGIREDADRDETVLRLWG